MPKNSRKLRENELANRALEDAFLRTHPFPALRVEVQPLGAAPVAGFI